MAFLLSAILKEILLSVKKDCFLEIERFSVVGKKHEKT